MNRQEEFKERLLLILETYQDTNWSKKLPESQILHMADTISEHLEDMICECFTH